jgi:hypothetical protein
MDRSLPTDLKKIVLQYAFAPEQHVKIITLVRRLVTHAKQLSNMCGPVLEKTYKDKKRCEVEDNLLILPQKYIKQVCQIAKIFHHTYRLPGVDQANMSGLSWLHWLRKGTIRSVQKQFASV